MQVPMIAGAKTNATLRRDRIDKMRRSCQADSSRKAQEGNAALPHPGDRAAGCARLIAIVLYYTQARSVTIEHVSSLALHPAFCALELSPSVSVAIDQQEAEQVPVPAIKQTLPEKIGIPTLRSAVRGIWPITCTGPPSPGRR